MTSPGEWDDAVVDIPAQRVPALSAPTYTDRVRFRLAFGLVAAVFCIALILVILVAASLLSIQDAKELTLAAVALFGIVSPVIGFYFASAQG